MWLRCSASIPVPVSPSVAPGFNGGPLCSPVNTHDAAGCLRDHVEGEILFVRTAFPEAFHLAVDDARIDLAQLVVTETQALDRSGGEVLHEHVGFAREILDDL